MGEALSKPLAFLKSFNGDLKTVSTATNARICSHCEQSGHNKRSCPFKGKKIRRCGKCEGVGHNSRTCPKEKRKSKQKTKVKVKVSKKKQQETGRKCGNCGKFGTGHNSRTCPKGKGKIPQPKGKKGKVSPPKTGSKKGKVSPPQRPVQKPQVRQEVLAQFPSQSNPDVTHEVRRGKDKVIYCTCPGWRMAKKRNGAPKDRKCWHLDRVEVMQADALAALS